MIKKIVIDFGLSIIASSIAIFGLQIVVYPAVAKIFGGNTYGELLLVMAIVNVITSAFGMPLNTPGYSWLTQVTDYGIISA